MKSQNSRAAPWPPLNRLVHRAVAWTGVKASAGTHNGGGAVDLSVAGLTHAEQIRPHPRQYVNRLSDLMFVLARVLNRFAGGSDVLWQHERKRG